MSTLGRLPVWRYLDRCVALGRVGSGVTPGNLHGEFDANLMGIPTWPISTEVMKGAEEAVNSIDP